MRTLYTALMYLCVPALLLRLLWRGRKNRGYWMRWGERFGYGPSLEPNDSLPVIWIHAVSVGEVQACVPLVHALRERWSHTRVLVTTTTPTGRDRVVSAFGGTVVHTHLPFDLPDAVARFLDRARPRIAIVMETELWPNLFEGCAQRSIPVVLANARLSQRSAHRYGRVAPLVAELLSRVSVVAAQTQPDATRLIALGAPEDRVEVTGSIKFDLHLPASLREHAQALRRRLGVERGIWIAASTHEGEEELVLDAFCAVLRVLPDTLLLLAPRHPERFATVANLCRRRGYHTVLRTNDRGHSSFQGLDVYVGDTMGELPLLYAAADLAFVGGSFVEVGGHNMLEPAGLGVPVFFGPHTFNFEDIARRLEEMGAAARVVDAQALGEAVVRYLDDANHRYRMGENGARFVEENRGALDQLVELVARHMDVERTRGSGPGSHLSPVGVAGEH